MFNGLRRRKFHSKCKTAIKLTKARIEMIKRKRNAMQKYLKKDIADLLKNGLHINAYGRAEGLLVELNLSSCYELLEQFCVHVSIQISVMDKQRECPEACREAVSSLMFGASRFADLPELRDLRGIFSQRYANVLESYVNKEFVEKLRSMPPTKDIKLQLLHDIASEYGIGWNSKAMDQKLYNAPATNQEKAKHANADKYTNLRSKDQSIRNKDDRSANYEDGNLKESAASKIIENNSFHGEKGVKNDASKLHDRRSAVMPERDDQDCPSHGRQEDQQKGLSSARSLKEEFDDKNPSNYRLISPPYVKRNEEENETSFGVFPAGAGGEGKGTTKFDVQGNKEDQHHKVDKVAEAKPKPRSVRRRPLKPPPGHENIGNAEVDGNGQMDPREIRQDVGKEGMKILGERSHQRNVEEEETIDRLLMHYSKKKSPYGAQLTTYTATKHGSRDGPPTRAASLPVEPPTQSEAVKLHSRVSSYQLEVSSPERHVHPKLPDYDDFLARLAALRGK